MAKKCTYKGKTYLLLWVGDTKYGRRAKLGFESGKGEFWVGASLVQEITPSANTTVSASASPSPARRASARAKYPRTGCSCGSLDGYPRESDCRQCQHDY